MSLAEVRSAFPASVQVLMDETVDLVRFCRDHWSPIPRGEGARPGLIEAGHLLPSSIAEDLLSLEDALHTAQVEYLLTIPPIHSGLRSRAEHVASELLAALEWLLDDGQHDERDQQLHQLRQDHAFYSSSIDVLCAKLADYAALASQLRPRLANLAGFDMAMIDDAHHLARELRLVCESTVRSADTARALDLRNRIATLLVDRMAMVRVAAGTVFRNHPSIVRLAGSTLELRQRGRTQRAATTGEPATKDPIRQAHLS